MRDATQEGGPPTVALIGYTNAGKTTILNALSGAGRSIKDRLFETLETTTHLELSPRGETWALSVRAVLRRAITRGTP